MEQMLSRTLIVFVAALVFIRLSGMRTFGTSSAFDVLVSISPGASICIVVIFTNGELHTKQQHKYNITDKEMMAAVHEQNMDNFDNIKTIFPEPDGQLSIVKKTR